MSHGGERVRTNGRLDEGFFDHPRSGRVRRLFVLPLAPIVVVWAVTALVGASTNLEEPPKKVVRVLATATDPEAARPVAPGCDVPAEQLRLAYLLLARNDPAHDDAARAERILASARVRCGDRPFLIRALAEASRHLGHREEAAQLYRILLQKQKDDIEALKFFLAYRYEDGDLAGALSIADRLRARHALDGDALYLASRIEAEAAARAMAREAHAGR